MHEVVLEVDNLTKTFRIHRERANSLKQRIAAKGRNRFDEFIALEDVTGNFRKGSIWSLRERKRGGKGRRRRRSKIERTYQRRNYPGPNKTATHN